MRLFASAIALLAILTGCSEDPVDALSQRQLDPITVEAGRTLYTQNCAACHGAAGVGPTGDWRQRDAQGNLPPPPLNGSAHTWHHSNEQLIGFIQNDSGDTGNMPAWKDKLTEAEISSILQYVKTLWPDEVYEIWHQQWGQR